MKKNIVSFYFQELDNKPSSNDDLGALIKLHIDSFESHGWAVVRADESVSRKHRLYELFNDRSTILSKSKNPWEYTRACYMRWLAYAVLGHPYADFDVINYGFTPEDATNIHAMNTKGNPVILSAAGAMGLLGPADYEQVIQTYVDFIQEPVLEGPILEDINDMTILRHIHPEWYNCPRYSDERFVKDYKNPGWETAKLVHWPHGLTPMPRFQSINAVRPPL